MMSFSHDDYLREQRKRQADLALEVHVEGFGHWLDALDQVHTLDDDWARIAGKREVTDLELALVLVAVNGRTSENVLLSTLMQRGFRLTEARVSFYDGERVDWGVCDWIPDHLTYADPQHSWREWHPEATDYEVSLVSSWFRTEVGGENKFTLLSTSQSSSGFLFHKTLLFHRMGFAAPSS